MPELAVQVGITTAVATGILGTIIVFLADHTVEGRETAVGRPLSTSA